MNIKKWLYDRSMPHFLSDMSGKALVLADGSILYLYLSTYSLFKGHKYLASKSHIMAADWITEKELLEKI